MILTAVILSLLLRFLAYESSSSFGLPSYGTLFASRGVMCEGVTQIRHSARERVIACCIHFISRSEIVWHLETRGSFFKSHCDTLFLKREKMNYGGHSIGVWTLTMSGIFTLDGVYVPTQKQTGNLQGSGRGTDHGLRTLVECLTDWICCFCAIPLKRLLIAKRKGHLIVQSSKSHYPRAFNVIVLPSVRLTDMQNLGETMGEACRMCFTVILTLLCSSLVCVNSEPLPFWYLKVTEGQRGEADELTKHLKSSLRKTKLLTLKEGEYISPLLHFIWSWSQIRVMFSICPVEWLQDTSPDDWKMLENTHSFCCSALLLAQFRSVQYKWDYCVMQNASSWSCVVVVSLLSLQWWQYSGIQYHWLTNMIFNSCG